MLSTIVEWLTAQGTRENLISGCGGLESGLTVLNLFFKGDRGQHTSDLEVRVKTDPRRSLSNILYAIMSEDTYEMMLEIQEKGYHRWTNINMPSCCYHGLNDYCVIIRCLFSYHGASLTAVASTRAGDDYNGSFSGFLTQLHDNKTCYTLFCEHFKYL